MPIMNGLQAAPEIVKTHPKLPMLLISVQESRSSSHGRPATPAIEVL